MANFQQQSLSFMGPLPQLQNMLFLYYVSVFVLFQCCYGRLCDTVTLMDSW